MSPVKSQIVFQVCPGLNKSRGKDNLSPYTP